MDVVMPQMGESIAQGTITKWLKSPGDKVEKDETLFEIATDKVDAEIPSPAAGTLGQILIEEGATVDVGTIVAKLDTGDGVGGGSAPAPAADPGKPHFSAPEAAPAPVPPPAKANGGAATPSVAPAAVAAGGELFPASAKGIASQDDLRRLRSTPVVPAGSPRRTSWPTSRAAALGPVRRLRPAAASP
jgi:2-oxoglutarate dehydrogenase E2 component (dihydrolipoamide succinyltransferase)